MSAKVVALAAVVVIVIAGVGGAFLLMDKDKNPERVVIDVDLEIFGNADKNDVIDENDAKMVEGYIEATNDNDTSKLEEFDKSMSKTFADANHDGIIDDKDVIQIRSIISGTEKSIWLLDGIGAVREIGTDIDRIGCEYFANTEICLLLGLQDKIYGVDYAPYKYRSFYFDENKANTVKDLGNMHTPSYTDLNTLGLDILLTFTGTGEYEAKQTKIADCDTIFLGFYNPDITNVQKSMFVQGVLKAGYIFHVVDRAQDYVNWLLGYRDTLLNIANGIDEKDKPNVLASTVNNKYFKDGSDKTVTIYSDIDPLGQAIKLAGGHNVLNDIMTPADGAYSGTVGVDKVFKEDGDLDCIVFHMVRYTYGGSETATTPKHGYLVNGDVDGKLASNVSKDMGLELVTDDMDLAYVAGEFRNGCTAGVLLGAYLGKYINPDAYASIDPVKMMNEYVSMMGITGYDAATDGLFFYTSHVN